MAMLSRPADFIPRMREDVGKRMGNAAMEIYRRIIQGNPVDSGRSQASWNMAINRPDLSVKPPPPPGSKGKVYFSETPVIGHIEPEDTIHITNNLPYIGELERGHSKEQAPNGFVRLAVADVAAAFSQLEDAPGGEN